MQLTQPGIDLIVQFEGFTPYAYNDPIGLCTAGPGILLHRSRCSPLDYAKYGTREKPGISRSMYFIMLHDYVEGTLRFLERVVKVPLSQPQVNALVSLVHNIGEGGFASSTVLRELNQRHYKKAAVAFQMWVRGGGQVLPGLVRRRQAEMEMFLRGATEPVKLTTAEQTLMRRYSNYLDTKHVVESRELRVRDRLRAQAILIRKAAQRQVGGWEKYDRRRRYRAILRLLRKSPD